MDDREKKGLCVWFVGLPGSGKSSISKKVYEKLCEYGVDVVYLEMDKLRKKYVPIPKYTKEERDKAYRLFVDDAYKEFLNGRFVIMDGTAYKKDMRLYARDKMGNRFAEIYIKCSVETAMERESKREGGHVIADLYKKALERKFKRVEYPDLGEVIGVDVEFEEDKDCEMVLENDNLLLDEAVDKTLDFILKWMRDKHN